MQDNAVKANDRQLQALELRKAGVSYQKIADALGYANAMGAWKAVNSALKKTLQEPADEVRKLEIERLDAMLAALWVNVKNGQYKANEVALRVMERRARLLGLDAPVKTDITSNGEKVVFEVVRKEIPNPTPNPAPEAEPIPEQPGEAESDRSG